MEQPFSLRSELRDDCLVIATSGYVNNAGGEAIVNEFTPHFERGMKRVVISLAESRVVNSIGMSFLIEIIDRLGEVDGRLVFTNLDPAVEKMLHIMGLFKMAGKEPTVDDALKTLAAHR
ncbi:MAG: anti-sigma factor antagonist [Planctomycetaceae bacterium]|nr:MAG: anti-sigma factor antagonist [Planctomycetaceae bacterium]